jgi:hypothetical protein
VSAIHHFVGSYPIIQLDDAYKATHMVLFKVEQTEGACAPFLYRIDLRSYCPFNQEIIKPG